MRLSLGMVVIVFVLSARMSHAQRINPDAKPFAISGSVGGNLSFYSVDGIPQRRQPLGYSIFGAVNLRIYGWSLPFSVAVSQQGSSLSQPFSRYGVSPEYKWIKLHLGHRNLRYSEFTLNGVTFLGGGFELSPGKYRISAMYGRLRQAVEESQNQFQIPQFERTGYGFKIGYGKKSFFDLSFFKASDDVSSVQSPDSLNLRNPPEASTSVGLTGRILFAKEKLSFDYDVGISAFTRDLRSPEVEEVEYLSEGLINEFKLNSSSNVSGAGLAGLQYKGGGFTTGLQYRYVQAGYRTLGANYLLSDLEMITLNAGANLFKNRLSFSGSYGIQNNNLADRRFAETGRNIGSLNLSFRPTDRLNFNLSYSNFSIYQTLLQDTLFADSVVIDQTNHLLNFGATYVVLTDNHTHTYSINGTFQELSDQRENAITDAGNELISVILTYGIRFNEKNYGFSVGINYQDFSSFLTAQTRYGGNVSFNMTVLDKKLALRIKQVWNRSVLETRNDDLFNTQLTANYSVTKKQSVNVGGGFISRQGLNRFNESRISIGYRYRF